VLKGWTLLPATSANTELEKILKSGREESTHRMGERVKRAGCLGRLCDASSVVLNQVMQRRDPQDY
jgi:hypothetical protein